jgi:hypothetical protein
MMGLFHRYKAETERRYSLFSAALKKKWQTVVGNRSKTVKLAAAAAFIIAAALLIVFSYVSIFTHGGPHVSKKSGSGSSKKSSKPPTSSTNAATSKPAPVAIPGPQAAPQLYPSSILNLTNWKLTLPVSGSGGNSPQEITQPRLTNFVLAPYFQVNGAGNGVQFEAPVGGVTTTNSSFPRSELREMANNGAQEASWSDTAGTNTMIIRQAITHLPAVRLQLVAGQIHGPSDYVILIRLEGSNLFVEANGNSVGTLDSNYHLGDVFTVQVVASNGHIVVLYNGAQKVDYAKSGSGYYFKAGCYTQSNPSKGDSPNDYGQVVIYGLQVSHT